MPITLDGTNGITTPTYGGADTSEYLVPVTQFKNRIINGAMVIDQRNAGASVTPSTNVYTLDRWFAVMSAGSKYSVQQNAGSVTPPIGFNKYLGITSLSAYSITASDYFLIQQRIEGFNFADLNWGSADAKTVTLSFWVRSSLTGTFGGSLVNESDNRSYPFSYTISSANTWQQTSITIAGDTTGTWTGATNGVGVKLNISFGVGSTFSGTAGSWAGANYLSATGATSVVGTNGATFYITGVQLEVGSTATSFDYRPYGTELALCQRYYNKMTMPEYVGINGFCDSTTDFIAMVNFPVVMRDSPTFTSTAAGANLYIRRSGGTSNTTSIYQTNGGTQNSRVFASVASGLTGGQGAALASAPSQTTFIAWSAEL